MSARDWEGEKKEDREGGREGKGERTRRHLRKRSRDERSSMSLGGGDSMWLSNPGSYFCEGCTSSQLTMHCESTRRTFYNAATSYLS